MAGELVTPLSYERPSVSSSNSIKTRISNPFPNAEIHDIIGVLLWFKRQQPIKGGLLSALFFG